MNFDEVIFAEIEIGGAKQKADANPNSGSSVLFSQPIVPRAVDPVREKFFEMRRLSSMKPFAGSDCELFYRQARFMADFTDNYEGNAKFNMYFPYYQNMGYEYLRTYFTWRTRVRNGDMQNTSLSYIFLYIYELLSGIGVTDPNDGLSKLMDVWNKFSKENQTISKYLSKWLKDYFIFYELPVDFLNFIEENNMQTYYSLTLLFDENTENKLNVWNNISGYDVTSSRFYKDGNETLLNDCFSMVLKKIHEFCSARNTKFEDLLVYSVSRRTPWQPFKQALFKSNIRQSDREIIISGFEKYYCKNNLWTASLPVYYSSQKDFVGYVIKKTEACLRKETNYKYKLVAEMKAGSKPFRELQRPAAKRAELDKLIEKTVAGFYKDLNRTVVTVDFSNLSRIREEALETQEQLIVPEENIDIYREEIKQNETTPEETAPFEDIKSEETHRSDKNETITLSFADGWKALRTILTDIEKHALIIALTGNSGVKTFADENNIMLEVLGDGINEKTTDYIGDSILEIDGDMILYDEYRENIKGLVK